MKEGCTSRLQFVYQPGYLIQTKAEVYYVPQYKLIKFN